MVQVSPIVVHKKEQPTRGVLIVLGGSARKNGAWRTTLFEQEGDRGDRLRVVASAHLYRKKRIKPLLIASGGRGMLPLESPPVATILSKELGELGVPAKHIVTEARSGNTYEQLCECTPLLPELGEIALVSNEYHLPRVRALIEHRSELAVLKKLFLNGRLSLLSAEAVLIAADERKWKKDIEQWYRSPLVAEIVRKEKEGVSQITSGSYAFV
jgi:hypothetical protein